MNDSLLDFYYQKYKKYLLSAVIVILGMGIVWQVAVPQVFSILKIRDDIAVKQKEIAKLESTLTTLNSFNDANLDSDIKTATIALPSSKEFLGMYLGIVSASSKAQVNIIDFATQIGTLYVRQGVKSQPDNTITKGPAPSLTMKVTIDATSADQIQSFTEEIHKVLPLAEVKKIEYTTGNAAYEIAFYYDKVEPSTLAKQVNISALSPDERTLLNQLSEWNVQTVVPTGAVLPTVVITPTSVPTLRVTAPSTPASPSSQIVP